MQISASHLYERKTAQLTPSMTSPSPKPAASEYDSRSMLFSASGPGGRPEHFKHQCIIIIIIIIIVNDQ